MDTIAGAAARTGVSAHTLRAWERRYELFRPTRTPAGYRVYDPSTLERIEAMRELVAQGVRPREAAAEVARRLPPPGGGAAVSKVVGDDLVDVAVRLDGAALDRLLDAHLNGDLADALDRWLLPGLGRLGRAWADGTVSVAGEHFVAHAVMARLAAAYEAGPAASGPAVVIGAPPGVQHELGLLAFAVVARAAGVPTLYLGADVPLSAWSDAVAAARAPGVVTVAPRRVDVPRVAALAAQLGATHPGVPVWVGGGSQHLVAEPCRPLGHELGRAARTLADALS